MPKQQIPSSVQKLLKKLKQKHQKGFFITSKALMKKYR